MSTKYPGGFITKSPVLPAGPYETSVAKGMWTLDQAMQFKKQGLWPTAGNPAPLVPGQAYQGGYFVGQISTAGNSIADYNLVVGPVASAQSIQQWKIVNTGADPTSVIDGPTNSATMNSAVYPAAQFCEGLTIGGFSDWYMPAMNELEICYYNLKPTTTANTTGSGTNINAVPSRPSNYTAGNPAQTTAAIFQAGGSEAFATTSSSQYWCSTQLANPYGRGQAIYSNGDQDANYKTASRRVRAVRRVAV